MNNKNSNLHWKILVALLLAIIAGLNTEKDTNLFNITLYDCYDFLGTLFLNGLRMISIPLIVASIISGMASIGSDKAIGKIGVTTLIYYLLTSTTAIILGLVLINLIKPGLDPNLMASHTEITKAELDAVFNNVKEMNIHYVANIFYQLVPSNIFHAAAEGQLLGLIVFSLLFGYFILHVDEKQKRLLTDFWNASFEVIMLFTMFFLRFAPIGVFGLVAKSIASTGFTSFYPVLKFFVTVLLALSLHMFVFLSLILYFLAKVNPLHHIKAMIPVLLTAFSTSSSSATLPVSMECTEKNAGVSNKVTSFVLPLGATVNMNGTALYEGMAVIFIAQSYGLTVGIEQQFIVLIMALLTSVGVAGIPSASLVAITIILTAIGIPLEGIGIIMITDRILDMCRTCVNVYSDTCGAVLVGVRMGEKNILSDSTV